MFLVNISLASYSRKRALPFGICQAGTTCQAICSASGGSTSLPTQCPHQGGDCRMVFQLVETNRSRLLASRTMSRPTWKPLIWPTPSFLPMARRNVSAPVEQRHMHKLESHSPFMGLQFPRTDPSQAFSLRAEKCVRLLGMWVSP